MNEGQLDGGSLPLSIVCAVRYCFDFQILAYE